MKLKFFLSFIMASLALVPSVADANDATLMCGPESPNYSVDPHSVSCSPEQYGFSYDYSGNLVPLPMEFHDGPSISEAPPPSQTRRTPPPNPLDDLRILEQSFIGNLFWQGFHLSGQSYEDAMNAARFGQALEGVGGALSGAVPYGGFTGYRGSVYWNDMTGGVQPLPRSPGMMEQQLGNQGTSRQYYP